MTLEQAGLVSIRLDALTGNQDRIKLDRNALVATTSFLRSDGTTGTAADVSLAYRPGTAHGGRGGALGLRPNWVTPNPLEPANALGIVGDDMLSVGDIFEMLRLGDAAANDLFDRFDRSAAPIAADSEPALRVSMVPQSNDLFAGAPRMLEATSNGLRTQAFAAPENTTRPADMLVNAMEAHGAAGTAPWADNAHDAGKADATLDWQRLDEQGGPEKVGAAALGNPVEATESENEAAAEAAAGTAAPARIDRSDVVLEDTAGGPEAVSAEMWADLGATPAATGEAASEPDAAEVDASGDDAASDESPTGKLASVDGAIMGGENATPGGGDAELARKLMLIRQDLGSFGASGAGESDRLTDQTPDPLQIYG